jgi:hypothetical protein
MLTPRKKMETDEAGGTHLDDRVGGPHLMVRKIA